MLKELMPYSVSTYSTFRTISQAETLVHHTTTLHSLEVQAHAQWTESR